MPRWPQRTVDERFWSHVEQTEGCWLWTASTVTNGYGQFSPQAGSIVLAHVFAWSRIVGPIPDGYMLDHKECGRLCVRPDHLRLATSKQNQENRLLLNKNNSSGVRGVSWSQRDQVWCAEVTHDYRKHRVGNFKDLAAAEEAVVAKRLELFTHNTLDRTG